MKKQYIQPAAMTVAALTSTLLAGSGDQPGSDQYSSTYGNTGQEGGSNTDAIKKTEGSSDDDFTMGAKQNAFNTWDD